MQPRLPDFYVPSVYTDVFGLGTGVIASGGWPVNNKALYTPVIFPYPCTLTSVSFGAGNGTGNYDVGFYDGYTKTRVQSTGSTAMSAAGAKTMTFTVPYRVDAGKVYYAGLALSSTSGQIYRSNSIVASVLAAGMGEQTSSLPLPSTMAPVTVVAAYIPFFCFGVR